MTFAILLEADGAGAHPAAARAARATRSELLGAAHLSRVVREAERAGFTAVTLEDTQRPSDVTGGAGRVDSILRAAFQAPLTGSIGLVPVLPALYNEPFHIATQLSSLDTASLGRAGWIAVPDTDAVLAGRHGRAPLAAELADEELADVVESIRRLWDSWEDDAVIRDVATGRYLDRDRLHYADFEGHRFSVKGPSILPRSPQAQPVVFGPAGTSAEVDVALIEADGDSAEAIGAAAREAASAARAQHPSATRIVLQLEVVLDSAGLPAAERLARLDRHTPWQRSGRGRFAGTAGDLAVLLADLAEAGAVDGVRLFPATLDADLDELGRAVLPELRRRGVFTSPRAGDILRESFGLPRPANRFLEAAK